MHLCYKFINYKTSSFKNASKIYKYSLDAHITRFSPTEQILYFPTFRIGDAERIILLQTKKDVGSTTSRKGLSSSFLKFVIYTFFVHLLII